VSCGVVLGTVGSGVVHAEMVSTAATTAESRPIDGDTAVLCERFPIGPRATKGQLR
jgi:hypothetical protein